MSDQTGTNGAHGQPHVIALDGATPRVDPAATVLPGATVVGDVVLGARANVWYGAVVRGDDTSIEVGEDTNLQDGVIVHADPGFPARIGSRVTVGHGAVVHGALVEDGCLIGMRAVLLNGARVGAGSLIAAGAVVLEGAEIPPGSLVAGVPAKVRRELSEEERDALDASWRSYVRRAARHAAAIEEG